jgi:sugar phosphate permease
MRKIFLYATLILGWLFILYVYAVRVSNGVIVDKLIHSLGIGPGRIGILSSSYYLTYILMQIPAGLLIDRYGIRRCWPVALMTIALGCYVFAHSHSTLAASLGRGLIGFGSAFAWVGAVKIIYQLSNGRNDALFIGISMTLCMAGAMLGQSPWLYLTDSIGSWQAPYTIAAFVGVILSLLVFIFGHNYRHHTSSIPSMYNIIKSCLPLIRSTPFLLLMLYMTTISIPQNAFSALWANEFLKRDYHLPGQLAATVLSCIWLGGLLGAPVIGLISDRIKKHNLFLVAIGIATAILMLAIIFWRPHSIWIVAGILFLIGFLSNASVIIYALASQMAPNTATSAIIGVANMINMGGAALIQLLIGSILSHTMHIGDMGNFTKAFIIIPILIVFSSLLLLSLKQTSIKLGT